MVNNVVLQLLRHITVVELFLRHFVVLDIYFRDISYYDYLRGDFIGEGSVLE